MTDEELTAIKARAEAATPGPWNTSTTSHDVYWELVENADSAIAHVVEKVDGDFIAHARADIPALLTERDMLLDVVRALANYPEYRDEDGQLTILRTKARALLGLD